MKTNSLIIIAMVLLMVSCKSSSEILIEVINLSDQQRDDATVLLNRGEISNMTEIPEGKIPVLKSRKGVVLPCQADDVNGDGLWDELFAPIDMEPGQQKTLILDFIESR